MNTNILIDFISNSKIKTKTSICLFVGIIVFAVLLGNAFIFYDGIQGYYPWLFCVGGCCSLIFWIWFVCSSYITWKKGLVCFFVAVVLSAGIWSIVSFGSYYHGVTYAKDTEASLYKRNAAYVLNNQEIGFDEKVQLLQRIIGGKDGLDGDKNLTKAEIKITNPQGKVIFYNPNGRTDYVPEIIRTEIINTPEGAYEYYYQYNNKPPYIIGILRAISFSLLPRDSECNWATFMQFRLYERSQNFWIPFFVIYLLSLLVCFEHQLQKNMAENLEASNEKLNKAINNLDNFKLAYQKINRDFSGGVSNSENNLQHMQSFYDKASLETDLKNAVGIGRHDVLNRIKAWKSEAFCSDCPDQEKVNALILALRSCESEGVNLVEANYDLILGPWIEVIHNELKELDKTLDITFAEYGINDVIKTIQMAAPANILASKKSNVEFIQSSIPVFDGSEKCMVILNKVKSIVFNLIQNSATATNAYKNSLIKDIEAYRAYKRKISLLITKEEHDNIKYLCVEVNDNGGGFPDSVIDKVYKKPIPTTKDNRKHGEGTSYVGFFVDLMKCKIKAQNIVNENGEKGASTKFYIPYSESKK